MKRRPEILRFAAAVAALGMFAPICAFAQTEAAAQSRVYTPNRAPQSPPLRVEILDGARFRDIETRAIYRLYGVETCAPDQTARLGRQPWPCGTVATAWLVAATLDKWVACTTLREENGERLARCASPGHADIGADMVRAGVAVATPPTKTDRAVRAYVAAEREARKAYRGLWASSFEMPWEFRANAALAAAHGGKAAP